MSNADFWEGMRCLLFVLMSLAVGWAVGRFFGSD
jgi:hypothetical protein